MSSNMHYMLTVEKTRQHNMKDVRWTMRDKATAYNGIVKLYSHDRKKGKNAIDAEVATNRDRVNTLSEKLFTKKVELEQIMSGSKHRIDAILVGHKELRLATRQSKPQTVIEAFKQNIFTCRRKLDLILFKRKSKEEHLKELLLERMELQEIRNNSGKSALELECQKVTGKVQDRLLLTEAAISVRETYKTLIALMTKDNTYYSLVLKALELDRIDQNRCQIHLIKLGQIATEEIYDYKMLFLDFQKISRKNYHKRIDDLEEATKKFKKSTGSKKMSQYVDEHIGGCRPLPPGEEYEQIVESISSVQSYMDTMRIELKVSTYDMILPCLKKQHLISEKLNKFREKMENDLNTMRKSVRHSQVLAEQLNDYDVVQSYDDKVKYLKNEIMRNRARTNAAKNKRQQLSKKLVNTRTYLHRIEDACLIVEEETIKQKMKSVMSRMILQNVPKPSDTTDYQPTGYQSIELISRKLNILMQITHATTPTVGDSLFRASFDDKTVEEEDNDLDVLDQKIETDVPTRQDIKEESQSIIMRMRRLEF